ncbi:MAG TPA: hypothetical protein VNM47_18595 [Terriglobia bacterium]|nr:hypothetical protein [Terriglobia bacterium]
MSTAINPIDRLQELGGRLFLDGDSIRYRIPCDSLEAEQLLAEIRKDRETIIALLRDRESSAPSLEEIRAALPPGVRMVSYQPKEAPFAVAPVSVVTDSGKFFRAYLRDLRWRIEHPKGYAAPPLAGILSRLADAGLELRLEWELGGDGPENGEVQT